MEKADVIIVGGGVIGTSIAFHLAKKGITDVVLLERSHLASGSTGKSVGIVESTYATEVNVAMGKAGTDELSRFPEVTGETADFHPRLYLETVAGERHRAYLERSMAIGRRHGLQQRILAPEEIPEFFPELRTDDVAAGLLNREAGFCDPHSVASGYARAAQRLGVRVHLNSPVERILVDGGKVVGVRTGRGETQAPVVVNAAGPWCNELNRPLGFELPVDLWQRQIFVTTPHPEIPADRPMYIDLTDRFYFRQELDGGFVLGLVEDVAARDLANPETDWDFKTKAVEAAIHRVPKLAETGIANAWSGIVTFTPDQLPVVGPAPGVEGLYLANGMSGYGVMISPAVGLILGEMVADGESKSIDASPLRADRFKGTQGERGGGLWLADG
ncbi:MAG TPA: FAD-binding oxidoreductase [Thermoplasmata archaeon]|nr:FAD-binding oxidoreductase [Thermoplasmata archaeon]